MKAYMAEVTTQEDEKNLGGRPLKFETVQALSQKIAEYFGNCDSHVATRNVFRKKADGSQYLAEEEYLTIAIPYGVEGLAAALDTNRETLNKYESGDYDDKAEADANGDRFSDVIKRSKQKIKANVEQRTLSGETPATAGIFWLKNHADWKDRTETDITSGGKVIAPVVRIIDERQPARNTDT